MTSIEDGRGIVYLTNQYDSSNRVTQQTLADPLATFTFAYTTNGAGSITQTGVTDPLGRVERLAFNASHYVTSRTEAYGTSLARTTTLTRASGSDLVTAIVDGMNRRTEYTYDADGHPLTETRLAGTQAAITTTYTYEPVFHQIATATDPLNHTWTMTYDAAGRIAGISDPLANQTTVAFNAAGQVTQVADALTHAWQLGYSAGDVTSVTDPLGNTRQRFVDAAGRVVASVDPFGRKTRRVLDTLGRVTSVTDPRGGTTAFTYDGNGSLTSDGTNTYTWNARNQLTAISGGVSASFSYDATERRRAKTVSGTTRSFLYDGSNLVQELSGSTPTANLLTGLAIDETFTRTESSATRTLLVDALGSTLAVTNTSGTVLGSYTFEAFGATTAAGTPGANPHQFTGRENDDTGLYYYRARYYDASRARFLSEDPLGELAGINVYSYVSNQPTGFIDPSGLLDLCCRPVSMPVLRQIGAKHCFVRLSDGTTLGGYRRAGALRPEKNAPDDRCPKDRPDCTPLPGSEPDVRKAWDDMPKGDRTYGLDGSSNAIPAELLDRAGVPYTMPPGAWGSGPIPTIPIPLPGGGVIWWRR